MTRAAIYLRVSTQGQADRELPIAGQERECRAYAERQGMQVVEVYADAGHSGRTDRRPEFQRMIADAKAGRFEAIVCWEVSRLSRVAEHAIAYVARLQRDHGVEVRSVTQAFVLDTAIGKLILTFLAGLAAYESDLISERTQRGVREAVTRGRRPGGTPPYGYRSEDARLVLRADEAPVVRQMWQWATSEHIGARAIATRLNELGTRTRRGGRWSGTMVHQILCNPSTRGHTVTRLYDVDPPELIESLGTHEGLLTEEEFAQLGWRLEHPDYNRRKRAELAGREPPTSRRRIHPLSGLLRCQCGAAYVARGGTGRDGRYYHSYACRKCLGGRRLSGPHWEESVANAVLDATLTREAIGEATQWLEGRADEVRDEVEREIESRSARLRLLRTESRNLTDAIAAAGVSPRSVLERIAAADREAEVEEAAVTSLRARLAVGEADVPAPGSLEDVTRWCMAMRHAVLTDRDVQREFLASVVDRIEVPPEGPLVLHYHLLMPSSEVAGSSQEPRTGSWLPITEHIRTRLVS